MRLEKDMLGEVSLPDDCLYGIETARAAENFKVSGRRVHWEMIEAVIAVKQAAAMANRDAGLLSQEKADAILAACGDILAHRADDAFITDALQGGAGTSVNMNADEVIANLGLLHMGHRCGEYQYLHPLDDVNRSQSTNDVYPTALRIAAIRLVRRLSDACSRLQESLQKKENEFERIKKLGRTELMDAVPITLGEEFGAYAQAIARDRWRIYKVEERLRQTNLGGTAVGTGSNASRKYMYKVTEYLRDLTGLGLARAEYPMDLTQNNDVFVEVSGLLKALAVNLYKISTDLRLMNSGPYGGLGEIHLRPLQEGSTIMPGKVNPVIPEMVSQAAMQVMASDSAIAMCAAGGNFELNAFMPMIADNLIGSLKLLIGAADALRTKCIDVLEADEEGCRRHLDNALVIATAFAPYIGYDKASELARECGSDREAFCRMVREQGLLGEEKIQAILRKL
ncbi:MAG: aspartate ammonia-lyase [Lachnospiraceae bacterium]|jgi:aspartate ammonia-lyase